LVRVRTRLPPGSATVPPSRIEGSAAGRSLSRSANRESLGSAYRFLARETTIDPTRRTLLQARVGDAFEANRLLFALLGDLVGPREFIELNVLNVRNLDV
jgi:DNA gyrase subunit B